MKRKNEGKRYLRGKGKGKHRQEGGTIEERKEGKERKRDEEGNGGKV